MNIGRVVAFTLRTGVILSSVLVALGLALYFIEGETSMATSANFSFLQVFQRVASGNPIAIILLGVIVLVATPVLRVLELLISYVDQRDRIFVALSFLVLLLMTLGIVLLPTIR